MALGSTGLHRGSRFFFKGVARPGVWLWVGSSGPLVLWSFGPLVFWFFWPCGPLVLRSRGPLVFWSSGLLVLWSCGPLVLQSNYEVLGVICSDCDFPRPANAVTDRA